MFGAFPFGEPVFGDAPIGVAIVYVPSYVYSAVVPGETRRVSVRGEDRTAYVAPERRTVEMES
jgi:hypothetical protein